MHFNDKKKLLEKLDKCMINKDNNLNKELFIVKKLMLLNNVELSTEIMLSWIKNKQNKQNE